MINKLQKITEAEGHVQDRRHTSKIRYQDIQDEMKEKAARDIDALEGELKLKRQELLDKADVDAGIVNAKTSDLTNQEIADLKVRFEKNRKNATANLIQEVFGHGNR